VELSQALSYAAEAEQEMADADRSLEDAHAHEAAVRQRASAALARRAGGSDSDADGSDGGGDGAFDVLPLGVRAPMRLALERVEAATSRAEIARREAQAAEQTFVAAEATADDATQRIMDDAARAAGPHPLGPASLAGWLLAPLGSCLKGSSAALAPAAARQLAERLAGAPFLSREVTRCYWRLWRGKWARFRDLFMVPAPPGCRQQALGGEVVDVDRVFQLLEVRGRLV
jgi:hypothetical protein